MISLFGALFAVDYSKGCQRGLADRTYSVESNYSFTAQRTIG